MFNKLQQISAYLFVIATMASMGILGAAQPGPPSQSTPTISTQPGAVAAPTVAPTTSSFSTEERMIRLEERVNLANERADNAYKLLQFLGVFAAVVLAFFSIRDTIIRWKEKQRQRGIDEIVMDMLNLQKASAAQQVRVGALHLAQVELSPEKQFAAVKNVNDVIEVVRSTLDFRLQQEAKVAEVLGEIERIKAERERTKKQKVTQALAILDQFKKMSRMQFAALTDEQYKRGIRLQGLANDLTSNLEEFVAEQGFEVAGSLLYACGVIAYYDNDVVEARDYLDHAAQCRASDHEGELASNLSYLYRFAFIHYFRSLIHKNWGDISEAQHEIEQSAKLLKDQASEFLTPVTRTEILSYIVGDEERCRADLQGLIQRIADLEGGLKNKGEELDANQVRLRNRMLLLLGNTHFQQNAFAEALAQYTKTIGFSSNDYYALFSAAQCVGELGDKITATDHFRKSLDAIELSGDLRRKRERTTRAVIAVIAAKAARSCDDNERRERYAREARELLSGNLTVGGLSPKFFSPTTKRLVNAMELLKEMDL